MKNFKYILVLLVFITNVVWAQNPNNHWQLGNSDVNFSTNPSTVSTSGVSTQYGNASISDDNGNLLFYTNGKTVWNKKHAVMTNGNAIGYNGVKNTIIVPNLANSNQFYIFRSEEHLCLCLTPDPTYYLYSIVEFNNINPLGIVLSINPNPLSSTTPENLYSKTLSDSTGIVANSFSFGGLTSTKNNDGTAFWVIMQSKNILLSYKIDSLGLNTIPIQSTFTNAQIYDIGTYSTSFGRIDGIEGSLFKMAPNNSYLIGLEYSSTTQSDQSDPDGNFLNFKNPFYKIDFNSTTGVFSNYNTFSGGIMVYQFEISRESNNLFFARMKYPRNAPPYISDVLDGEICVIDLTNSTNPIRVLKEFSTSTPSSKFNYLQRDKYGNLLVSSTFSISNRNLFIHKIDNQDSYSNSSIVINSIPLNNNPISVMPQLIPVIVPPCPSTLVLSTNVTSGVDKKQASVSIEASNTVNNGFGAIYHAPVVLLKPNFNAKAGSTTHLYPIGCTGTFVARQSQTESNIESEETDIKVKTKITQIAPNPNNGIFKININEVTEGTIVVTDLYGYTVYKSDFKNQKEFEMNLQDNPKGIYIVKVFSGDQTYTEKIIKN